MSWVIIIGVVALAYYFSTIISRLNRRIDEIEDKITKNISEDNFYGYLHNFMAFLRSQNVWQDKDYDQWNKRIENRKIVQALKKDGLFDEKLDKDLVDMESNYR
jgi:predicted transcriptional regulator YheO